MVLQNAFTNTWLFSDSILQPDVAIQPIYRLADCPLLASRFAAPLHTSKPCIKHCRIAVLRWKSAVSALYFQRDSSLIETCLSINDGYLLLDYRFNVIILSNNNMRRLVEANRGG
jgi:hypothetical protein